MKPTTKKAKTLKELAFRYAEATIYLREVGFLGPDEFLYMPIFADVLLEGGR